MLLKMATLVAILTSTVASGNQPPDLTPEPFKEDYWTVSYTTENSVHTSVNGQITHGDRLHVRLIKDHCQNGNLITFAYTTLKNLDIDQLKGELVSVRFGSQNTKAKIIYAAPFIAGYRATVDLGWLDLETLNNILEASNPIRMEFIDTSELQLSSYFDVMQNSWSNNGLRASLARAIQMCESL